MVAISGAICGILAKQFELAVHPYQPGTVHVVQLGHRRVMLWSDATYSWGVPAICATTVPWTEGGTRTTSLYYAHPDVNCWPVR